MSPQLREYLSALTASQRIRLARESRKALRTAWPHRHCSHKAPIIIRANLRTLRNLAAL